MDSSVFYFDIPEDVDDKEVCNFIGKFCDLTDEFGWATDVKITMTDRTSKRFEDAQGETATQIHTDVGGRST